MQSEALKTYILRMRHAFEDQQQGIGAGSWKLESGCGTRLRRTLVQAQFLATLAFGERSNRVRVQHHAYGGGGGSEGTPVRNV